MTKKSFVSLLGRINSGKMFSLYLLLVSLVSLPSLCGHLYDGSEYKIRNCGSQWEEGNALTHLPEVLIIDSEPEWKIVRIEKGGLP